MCGEEFEPTVGSTAWSFSDPLTANGTSVLRKAASTKFDAPYAKMLLQTDSGLLARKVDNTSMDVLAAFW